MEQQGKMEHRYQNQTWLFLYESTQSPHYHLTQRTFSRDEIRDLRILDIFRCIKIKGDVGDFAYFIHSESMKHPILLLDDDCIWPIWKKRCKRDKVVTIHIRLATDEHPADKRAANFIASRIARQEVVGVEFVPEYDLRDGPPAPKPEPRIEYEERGACGDLPRKHTLVWTLNETWDIQKEVGDLMVYINTGGDVDRGFSVKFLAETIGEQMKAGRYATDVDIPYWTRSSEGTKYKSIRLNPIIWRESLLRGPWKSMFDAFWKNPRPEATKTQFFVETVPMVFS